MPLSASTIMALGVNTLLMVLFMNLQKIFADVSSFSRIDGNHMVTLDNCGKKTKSKISKKVFLLTDETYMY